MIPPKIPIAAIQRLTIHDGPGVRDTVFVKGCPLHCIWCHNPECISVQRQLLYHANLCTKCRKCIEICPNHVHDFDASGVHSLNRSSCLLCEKCADACLFNALEICSKEISTEDVYTSLMRDRDFFIPEGGVTLSGGEPALYPDFCADLFERLRKVNIHTALDTCGAVNFQSYRKILPFTDLVLYDLKGMNPERHRINTGQDNHLIHENLRKIAATGVPVEIRMPIIPGYNDFPDDIEQTGAFLALLPSICKVRLLPYHSLAGKKYDAVGMKNTMPQVESPDVIQLETIAARLRRMLLPSVPVVYDHSIQ